MSNFHLLQKPFDIQTHKENFINYFETLIYSDGRVEYAVNGHQRSLIRAACLKLGVDEERLNNMCPKERYFEYNIWMMELTGTISVHHKFYIGKANEKQLEKLSILKREGIYKGTLKEMDIEGCY